MPNHYNILMPREYTAKDGSTKTSFTKIGVAFPFRGDKEGMTIQLEALPLQSIGQTGKLECKILLMPPMDEKSEKKPTELNDSVPF